MSSLLLPSATLEDKQPIYTVEHGCLVSKNADVTLAYQLDLPEIYTLSKQDFEAIHAAAVKAMGVLPSNTGLLKQDWFVKQKYSSDPEQERNMLNEAYEQHFNERPFLNHSCYLFITKMASNRVNYTSAYTLLRRSRLVPQEMMKEAVLNEFFNAASQFVRTLASVGIRCTPLSENELTGTETTTGLLEQYLSLNPSTTAPLVDIDFTQGLRVGSKRCVCYSLGKALELPAGVDMSVKHSDLSTPYSDFFVGYASAVGLQLNCNHLYNQYLFIDEPAKTIAAIQKKANRLGSLSLYSRQNAFNQEFCKHFLDEAEASKQLPVRAHANVLAWTERESEEEEVRGMVGDAITKLGGKARENTVDIGPLYWAGIPGNAGDFPAEETFHTFAGQAFCLWNMETNYYSSSSPVGIKLSDRVTGKPVHVDLSEEPRKRGIIRNRNKFILGGSGSGKSFFTNGLVRQFHEQGGHVLIIDIGNSYKGLCELRGGRYYTYQEDKPTSFNPFYVVSEPDVEKRESLKTLLVTLWKRAGDIMSQAEYVSVSTAITQYYQHLKADPAVGASFNTFYEFLQGPFTAYLQTEKVRDHDFDMQSFLYVLRPYYKGGEYDYLLNAEQQLDLTNESFIVFEIDNVKDHPILFPVVTLVIMDTFLQKMRTLRGVPKMFLIEEAWKPIATPTMASYLKYLVKTVRKFAGQTVIVTQEVADLITNPILKDSVISQSDCKILLDLSQFEGRFDELQEVLSLSEKQKALVLSINRNRRPGTPYNEVYIGLGTKSAKVYGVEVSKEEYATYTTEESEKVALFKKVDAGMSLEAAIQEFAQELREAS